MLLLEKACMRQKFNLLQMAFGGTNEGNINLFF